MRKNGEPRRSECWRLPSARANDATTAVVLRALARLLARRPAAAPRANPDKPRATPAVAAELARIKSELEAGRLNDAVAALKSLLELHPDIAEAHYLLGTIFHQQGNVEDARDAFLLASAFSPSASPPRFQLGLLELAQNRFAEAVDCLREAAELAPEDAAVHNSLGTAYLQLGRITEAEQALNKALALNPGLAQAHSNLGFLFLHHLERYEDAARHVARALELSGDDAGALCNQVVVLNQQGKPAEALALADGLIRRRPELPEPRLNRALILLERRDFERGWPDYEYRKHVKPHLRRDELEWKEWDGSSLQGHLIFVYGEQGIGDEIMFASCLPDLMEGAASCILECSPKLRPIFARSFPEAQVVAAGEESRSRLVTSRPDFKVAIGSLPLFFRRDASQFPRKSYLRGDPSRVEHWRAKLRGLPGRLKVGISWRGGLASTRRSLRSIPLPEWLPILSVPEIDFVSLQYTAVAEDMEALRSQSDVVVHHWQDAIDDYDETAALISALDLVVSVQTAAVHLAGALGARTIALTPVVPEWRYGGDSESMIWYPDVTLVRQHQLYEWNAVMHSVREALLGTLASQRVT
jgi:Flp pilus assembly protein TadD